MPTRAESLQAEVLRLEGQLDVLRGMLRDAIEAKASVESELLRQQTRYETLTQRVPWIVLRVRGDGCYADVNRYFAELVGREPRDIIDRPVGSVGEPQDWVEAVLRDDATESEVSIQVGGAERRFLLLAFRDRVTRASTVLALDQTDRARALAEARRQAERAEAANRAKSSFLAVMSHEIRTPMNGVLGMATLLGHTDLDAHQREIVATIQSSGTSLIDLIDSVLDLTKIEAGGIEPEATDFAPEPLARDIVRLFGAKAAAKRIRLEVAAAPGVPALVRGDPHRIRQVVCNLVSNALKFTDEGHVRVTLETHGGAGEPDGPRELVIAVEDSGIGIAPERLDAVFDPFTQADASTTRRFGGTGLGLNIAKGIATALGGSLRVTSEPGRGSRFVLAVPVQPAHHDGAIDPTVEGGQEGVSPGRLALRVLVAEDNPVNRRVAEGMLGHLGCQVVCVPDGRTALEIVADDDAFDVILMDMEMPVMDGISATRAIRARGGRHASIPIIAITANAMIEDRSLCLDAGMTDVLTKPVTPDHLRAALDRATSPAADES